MIDQPDPSVSAQEAAIRDVFTNEVIRAIGSLARQQNVCREQGGQVVFVTGMEAAREYLVEHLRDILTSLLSVVEAQRRENEELNRKLIDIQIYADEKRDVELRLRKRIENTEQRAEQAEAQLAVLTAAQEKLHQFPCGHFVWRIQRGDGSLNPPPTGEQCIPCRRIDELTAERDRLRAALTDAEDWLRLTLAPCDEGCECVLHTVQQALASPLASGETRREPETCKECGGPWPCE